MGKQYTFKTTKNTQYLEEVFDNMDSRARSEFIRSMIVAGMISEGLITPPQQPRILQMSDKKSDLMCDQKEDTKYVTPLKSDKKSDLKQDKETHQRTVIPEMSDKKSDKVQIDPPLFFEIEGETDIDLDSRLDHMFD